MRETLSKSIILLSSNYPGFFRCCMALTQGPGLDAWTPWTLCLAVCLEHIAPQRAWHFKIRDLTSGFSIVLSALVFPGLGSKSWSGHMVHCGMWSRRTPELQPSSSRQRRDYPILTLPLDYTIHPPRELVKIPFPCFTQTNWIRSCLDIFLKAPHVIEMCIQGWNRLTLYDLQLPAERGSGPGTPC